MTTELVEILLRARNEASSGLRKVESDLRQLDKAVQKSLFSTGFDLKGNFLDAKQFGKDALPALNAQIERWVTMGASVEEITDTLLPNYIDKLKTAQGGVNAHAASIDKIKVAFAALGGVMALQQAGRFAVEMAQLNTQVERSSFAFEHFSGGSAQAAANLRAVQRASGGTLSTLDAQNVAVVGLTQSLASNSQELEKMTRIARGIVTVSPIINDMETAFTQLGLTIANQSMMRLDQLGTSAVEVRAKMAELKAETKGLTDEQAFQDALMSILESKFDTLTDAAINQASGLEVLRKAWIDYRTTASESFGWVDDIARRLGNELNVETQLRSAYNLIDNLPPVISSEQQAIIKDVQSILDDPMGSADNWIDLSTQLDELIDKYYEAADARTEFFRGLTAGPKINFPVNDPMFTTEQDQGRLQTLEDFNKEIEKLIDTQARAVQVQVFENTGDIEKSAAAYAVASEQLSNWVARQKESIDLPFDEKLAVIVSLLPSYASKMKAATASTADLEDAADKGASEIHKLGETTGMMARMVNTAQGAIPGLTRELANLRTEAINTAGAVAAAMDSMSAIVDKRSGAQYGKLSEFIKTPMQIGDGMKAVALESGAAASGVAAVNSEYSKLESTISGIVSGAIGPVDGVDANDLLPRPDAVNENARRLADIAVNGFKGQEWLDEFASQVPDIYQALVESGDPKTAAATMLKDFQDGLLNGTGVLIDKERAKALVRRALLGESNTQALINEIAQELAAETGTALSTVQAQAQSILGGGGMSANSDTGTAFSRGMVTGVEGSSLGADLSGAVYTQVMASITLIEQTGTEAGNALVRGMSATFAEIPQNLIAALAGMVLPLVQAGIANQGGRTGAAAS